MKPATSVQPAGQIDTRLFNLLALIWNLPHLKTNVCATFQKLQAVVQTIADTNNVPHYVTCDTVNDNVCAAHVNAQHNEQNIWTNPQKQKREYRQRLMLLVWIVNKWVSNGWRIIKKKPKKYRDRSLRIKGWANIESQSF